MLRRQRCVARLPAVRSKERPTGKLSYSTARKGCLMASRNFTLSIIGPRSSFRESTCKRINVPKRVGSTFGSVRLSMSLMKNRGGSKMSRSSLYSPSSTPQGLSKMPHSSKRRSSRKSTTLRSVYTGKLWPRLLHNSKGIGPTKPS